MPERILIDTGPIVAILCREDANHVQSVGTLRQLNGQLITCWPVISEVVFLLRGRIDRVQALLQMLTSGAIRCVSLGGEQSVAPWLAGFYERFCEHAPDLADAAILYLAERDQVTKVFTLDARDFSVYRTTDNRALEVI